MKKISLVSAFVFIGMMAGAQVSADSVNKNEVAVSVLPIVNVLSGVSKMGRSSNFYFAYKRHISKDRILRAGFSFYPSAEEGHNDGNIQFDRVVDTMNVFTVNTNDAKRYELKLGMEKVFRKKRMSHGVGIDLTFHLQNGYRLQNYWWEGQSSNSTDSQAFYEDMNSDQHRVDSLTRSSTTRGTGAGIHFFYSPRVQLSKRIYLTGTFGPAMSLNRAKVIGGKNISPLAYSVDITTFDFTILLSDISIAYRF
jgi:hypothetical protein